jgi:hypothetical protein
MATDSQCWHCGRQLAVRTIKPPRQAQTDTAVPADTLPLPTFRTMLLYAALTAAALLILIATTRAIGQAPLFLANSNNLPQPGWLAFTDSEQQYTLNLPESWQLVDMARAADAPELRSSPPLQALGSTFNALVNDSQLLFLGAEDTAVFPTGAPVFVLVAHSQRLQQLTPEQLATYAQQQLPENVALVNIEMPEADTAVPITTLLFNIEQDEQIWRCLEHFVPGDEGLYLVNTCTSFGQFPLHQSEFETILRSFQPLDS